MPNYYIDPKTEDLIIYDPEENEIRVIKAVEETEYEEEREEKEPVMEKPRKTGRTPKKEKPKEKKPGEKRGRSRRLTNQMIDKIRSMKRFHSAKYIANELEISEAVIYKYTKGIEKLGRSDSKPNSSPKEKKEFKPFPMEQESEESEQSEDDDDDDDEEEEDTLT